MSQPDKTTQGPSITPDDIEANIASEHFFTGTDGFIGAQWNAEPRTSVGINRGPAALRFLTLCVLVLRNDTKIVGINYGAIDPVQHSVERGRQEARADAVRQIYPLLAHELRSKLAQPEPTEHDMRMAFKGMPMTIIAELVAEDAGLLGLVEGERSKLTTQPTTFQDRVRAEAAELDERVTKLKAFTSTEIFGGLPVDEQERMLAQLAAMTDYSACLAERIQAFGGVQGEPQ